MSIHRKNTIELLRTNLNDGMRGGTYYKDDVTAALAVIDAQNDIIAKMAKNLSNARKGQRDTQKAILRRMQEKEYWINRSQIAERRLEMTRNKMWKIEDMFRKLGLSLRTSSIVDLQKEWEAESKRSKAFLDDLDRAILEDLKK